LETLLASQIPATRFRAAGFFVVPAGNFGDKKKAFQVDLS
jgi:hypothetical protein